MRTLLARSRKPAFVLVLCLFGLALPSQAGINRWSRVGPDGGRVPRLAFAPTVEGLVVAATSGGGVAVSNDGGGSWETSAEGLASPFIEDVAVDPTLPTRLYAATYFGIARSDDGGATWGDANGNRTFDELGNAQAVAVAPSGTVYAAGSAGIFQSHDHGATWWALAPFLRAHRLVLDVANPAALWVASFNLAGVYRIDTAGGAPERRSEGLAIGDGPAIDLAVHPATGDHLLVALERGSAPYWSDDGGATWQRRPTGLPASAVRAIAFDPVDPLVAYAAYDLQGVYRTLDGGAHWLPTGPGLENQELLAVAVDPAHPRAILAGTASYGAFRGSNRGRDWLPSSLGLTATAVTSLLIDPGSRGWLYAGTEGLLTFAGGSGVFESQDAGSHWRPRRRGLGFSSVHALALQPGTISTVLAGGVKGLARSLTAGQSWSAVALPDPSSYWDVRAMAFDSLDPQTAYAVGGQEIPRLFFPSLFWKSTDGGQTWRALSGPPGWLFDVKTVPGHSAELYVAGVDGVLHSTDGGRTLEGPGTGLPVTVGYPYVALALHIARPGLVFAARSVPAGSNEAPLYRSRDGGASWEPMLGLPSVDAHAVLIDPGDPDRVFVATDAGVHVSHDGGESWEPMTDGLGGLAVLSLAMDPYSPTTLYAGTRGAGTFRITFATPSPCAADEMTLCLGDGRFEVRIDWRDFAGNTGRGRAVPWTGDTGTFWFFDSDNVEVIIKVLPGGPINGHFWLFYGALSNVEYTLRARDSLTGDEATYFNPAGTFASVGDTRAFLAFDRAAGSLAGLVAPEALTHPERLANSEPLTHPEPPPPTEPLLASRGSCLPDTHRLCLAGGRFAVEVHWQVPNLGDGEGTTLPVSPDTGAFWFFQPTNVELVVKVLDGRALNGHFWVFYGALSSVEYDLVVTDTQTGASRTYHNPSGRLASVGDTRAF